MKRSWKNHSKSFDFSAHVAFRNREIMNRPWCAWKFVCPSTSEMNCEVMQAACPVSSIHSIQCPFIIYSIFFWIVIFVDILMRPDTCVPKQPKWNVNNRKKTQKKKSNERGGERRARRQTQRKVIIHYRTNYSQISQIKCNVVSCAHPARTTPIVLRFSMRISFEGNIYNVHVHRAIFRAQFVTFCNANTYNVVSICANVQLYEAINYLKWKCSR